MVDKTRHHHIIVYELNRKIDDAKLDFWKNPTDINKMKLHNAMKIRETYLQNNKIQYSYSSNSIHEAEDLM